MSSTLSNRDGIACYIRKHLSYNHKPSVCCDIESIFVDSFLPKSKLILLWVLHCPPDKPKFKEYLTNSLKQSKISNIQEFNLIGDLNAL